MANTLLSELKEIPIVKVGDHVVQVEFGENLKPSVLDVARKELRESPENQQTGLQELKRLLQGEADLKVPLHNDLWLLRFLRPCKYYPDSAYKLVKNYFSFKQKNAELYTNLLPSNEKNVFASDIMICMLNRDQLGRRVLIIEFGQWKPNEVTLDEIFKGVVLYLEVALMEPETQICGAVVIFDMNGLTLSQATKFTPSFAKRIVDWLQDAAPARVKSIHIVDQPYIFKMVFALFKPFMREKLRNRITFHGSDRKSLHKYLDPEVLPSKYGGTCTLPRISGNTWLELLMKVEDEYKAINSYGYPKKS